MSPVVWHCGVVLVSLVVLAKAADVLVGAVVTIAHHFRISEAIAGATLAAAATSAPELGTTIFALAEARLESAPRGAENIGIGTVLGSAVFNMAVIIGLLGVLGGSKLDKNVVRRDGVFYAVSVLALIAALYLGSGGLGRIEGGALLGGYGLYLLWIVRDATRSEAAKIVGDRGSSVPRAALKLVATIAVVAASCHFLVASTTVLVRHGAAWAALPEPTVTSLVSLLVVAAGTSLPDLFTSVAALRGGYTSLAVSNALGSNTFDLLVCLGLPYALLGGHVVAREVVITSWFLLVIVLVFLASVVRGHTLRRGHGVLLLVLYAAFAGTITGRALMLGA